MTEGLGRVLWEGDIWAEMGEMGAMGAMGRGRAGKSRGGPEFQAEETANAKAI